MSTILLLQMLLAQRVVDNHVVHRVQELRPEVLAQFLQYGRLHAVEDFADLRTLMLQDAVAADVRGHDDEGVAEIDRPPLAVRQPVRVEQ